VVLVTRTASTDSLKAQRYVFVKKSASYASLTVISTTIILPAAPIVVHTPCLHPPPAQRKYRKLTTMKRKTTFAPHSNPNAHHHFLFHLNTTPSTNTSAYSARQPSINPQRPSPVIQVRSTYPVMYPADSHYSLLLGLTQPPTSKRKSSSQERKMKENRKNLIKTESQITQKQEEGARMQHVQTPIPFSQRTKIHHRLRTDAMLFSKTKIIEKQDRSADARKNQNQGQDQGPPTVPTPPPAIQFPSLCTQSRICKKQKSKTSDFELHRNACTHRIANSSRIRKTKLCFAASLLPALPFAFPVYSHPSALKNSALHTVQILLIRFANV